MSGPDLQHLGQIARQIANLAINLREEIFAVAGRKEDEHACGRVRGAMKSMWRVARDMEEIASTRALGAVADLKIDFSLNQKERFFPGVGVERRAGAEGNEIFHQRESPARILRPGKKANGDAENVEDFAFIRADDRRGWQHGCSLLQSTEYCHTLKLNVMINIIVSYTMSTPSLTTRHADLTQRLILDSAIELLQGGPVNELSVRAVARQGGMSERTVFRYFATRDDLLDAIAAEMSLRLGAPEPPTSLEELLAYPKAIYGRFEETAALTKAALHSELYHRIRSADAEKRGKAIRDLVDRLAPKRDDRERKLAAANILYHLIASTWHYYRFYFGFSLADSIACANMAIIQALIGLGVSVKRR